MCPLSEEKGDDCFGFVSISTTPPDVREILAS